MSNVPSSGPAQAPGSWSEASLGELMEFFSNRLLLKRYRLVTRGEEPPPPAVLECEKAFHRLAIEATEAARTGTALDALAWAHTCTDFSNEWIDVCHWISPKKFREFLTDRIGVRWYDADKVPADMETPPVNLKWYKNPGGGTAQQHSCRVCGVICNSLAQYKAHAQGRTHRALLRTHGLPEDFEIDPVPLDEAPKPAPQQPPGKKQSSQPPHPTATEGVPHQPPPPRLSAAAQPFVPGGLYHAPPGSLHPPPPPPP
eukprot:Sspe_Gene.84951::Locus_55785_Transcript_1_1_Confidence_1.000_Length_842::g.84951::m.84951